MVLASSFRKSEVIAIANVQSPEDAISFALDLPQRQGSSATTLVCAKGVSSSKLAVRPAFNLDLTAANSSAFIPMTTPTDISSTYDGEEQDYLDATGTNKWYNEDLFSSANANVKVEYLNSDGSALSTAKPIDSGEYKVKLTVQNSSKYVWANCKYALFVLRFDCF